MPRVVPRFLLRRIAILYLLQLYKREDSFVVEWRQLRRSSVPLLTELAKVEALAQVNLMILHFPWFEGKLVREHVEEHLEAFAPTLKNIPDLYALEQQGEQLLQQLGSYKRQLTHLAYRWKLRAPWADDELLNEDVCDIKTDIFQTMGMPEEAAISSGQLSLYFLPTLKIEVPWTSFAKKGRRRILAEISKELADYEAWLMASGAQEFPSSLEAHARWWFEHHVHHKTYDEIAQSEVYTPGGEQISYAKNVGAAVRKFSKLIGINPKNLK